MGDSEWCSLGPLCFSYEDLSSLQWGLLAHPFEIVPPNPFPPQLPSHHFPFLLQSSCCPPTFLGDQVIGLAFGSTTFSYSPLFFPIFLGDQFIKVASNPTTFTCSLCTSRLTLGLETFWLCLLFGPMAFWLDGPPLCSSFPSLPTHSVHIFFKHIR
jgi:hypothetical protein